MRSNRVLLACAPALLVATALLAEEGAPKAPPRAKVGTCWHVETFTRDRTSHVLGPSSRGPRLPGLPVLHDGVPEGWKRGSRWTLEVVRSEVATIGSRSLAHDVIALACDDDPTRRAELWFDARTRALARVVVGRSDRWLRGDLAFEEPEARLLGFPLDWPDWTHATGARADVPAEGRRARRQTIERTSGGAFRVILSDVASERSRSVQDWRDGEAWWRRLESAEWRAEVVAERR